MCIVLEVPRATKVNLFNDTSYAPYVIQIYHGMEDWTLNTELERSYNNSSLGSLVHFSRSDPLLTVDNGTSAHEYILKHKSSNISPLNAELNPVCHLLTLLGKAGLERPRGFQEVKVPRFHDNGTGRW